MNYEEYLKKIKQLEREAEDRRIELIKDFIRLNNPYKVGDIVTDYIGSILIESIGVSYGFRAKPCATYTGMELKKDGTPTKKESRRTVWQSNLKF